MADIIKDYSLTIMKKQAFSTHESLLEYFRELEQKGRTFYKAERSFAATLARFRHMLTNDQMPMNRDLIGVMRRPQDKLDLTPIETQFPGIREKILCDKPIEIRHVNPINPFKPEQRPPEKYVWFRAIGPLPDDMAAHHHRQRSVKWRTEPDGIW